MNSLFYASPLIFPVLWFLVIVHKGHMFPLLFLPLTFLTALLFLKQTSPREGMVWVRRRTSVKESTEEPERSHRKGVQ